MKNALRDEWNISSYDPNIMEEFRVSGMTVHKVSFPLHREAYLYDDCCNPHNSKDYFARLYQLLNDDNNEDYWKYLYTCFNDVSTRTLELIFSSPHSLGNIHLSLNHVTAFFSIMERSTKMIIILTTGPTAILTS